jgi:hypothetical protein
MKKLMLVFLICIFNQYFSQNQIIYAELYGGFAISKSSAGISSGISANYQIKKDLFTLRYSENYFASVGFNGVIPFIPLPYLKETIKLNEFAALYGKRWINDNVSYSISGGISINRQNETFKGDNSQNYYFTKNTAGFPFEANIKWFKSNKEPYRIYGIVPVGKPTAIGNSIGFKLLGNISKRSYVGLALVYGIGLHKIYGQ